MTRVSSVVAAATVAAAVLSVVSAVADPIEPSRAADRFLLFSGADLWHEGAFLYGGSMWAPFGLDADGPVVKVLATRGTYRYRSGALGNVDVVGAMDAVAVMPGLHFTRNGVSVTVFAGFDRQDHILSPDDPGNVARGLHTGARIAADLWVEPTPQTMVTGSMTLTTIASAYAIRGAAGWKLLDAVYLGPEALIYGSDNYRQARIGFAATGLTFKAFELQGGIGYAVDADRRSGLYVRVGVTHKR